MVKQVGYANLSLGMLLTVLLWHGSRIPMASEPGVRAYPRASTLLWLYALQASLNVTNQLQLPFNGLRFPDLSMGKGKP